MNLEREITEVAESIAELHRTVPLQRAVDATFHRLEPLLTLGVPHQRLAAALSAAGVTTRDGAEVTADYVGAIVSRARTKARRAGRPTPSPAPGAAAKAAAPPPEAPAEDGDLRRGGVMSTIAKIMQKDGKS